MAEREDMTGNEKNKTDRIILLVLLFLGIFGLASYFKLQEAVFPSASINFSKSKDEIRKIADQWIKDLQSPGNYPIVSTIFNVDNSAKNFFDFKLGTREANRVMKEEAPVFYWDLRYCEPKNIENIRMQISPNGELVAYQFNADQDRKLPSISHEEAREKATAFLCRTTGLKEDRFDLQSDKIEQKRGRTDHSFTFERKDKIYQGARLRTDVKIAGNLISEYNSMVHLPDSWLQEYKTIRTNNELLQSVAQIFYILLFPLSLVVAVVHWRRGNIRGRFVFTTAAILTAIFLADNYNEFPYKLFGYDSDTSYESFLIQTLLSPWLGAIFVFTISCLLASAGEIIYRKLFPEKMALEEFFTLRGLRSQEGRTGIILGILWCAVSLGYQIYYYYIGRKAGFWCPIQVDDYQIYASFLPWIGAISLAVFAASSEEILYRVLFIGFARKAGLKNFLLINFLQATAWGFMHSSYEQQPCYARGLEISIEGMLDGLILQRFGLLPCLLSHYMFDAFCCVTPLFKAPPSLAVSAAVPFLPVLIILFLSRKKTEEKPLLNKDLVLKESQETVGDEGLPIIEYSPIKWRLRWRFITFIVAALGLVYLLDHKTELYGEKIKSLKIDRPKAIETARMALVERKIDLSGYEAFTGLNNSYPDHIEEFQYIFEKSGLKRTIEIADKIERSALISVQFVKPLTQETYGVILDEEGKVLNIRVNIPEHDRGAKLDKSQAIALARNFLQNNRPVYSPLEEDQYKVEKQENRVDHEVTFKVPPYHVAEAPLKVTTSVKGDLACNIGHYWDLPTEWTKKREIKKLKDEIADFLKQANNYAMLIAVLGACYVTIRRANLRWKLALSLALLWGLLSLAELPLTLNNLYANYKVEEPLQSFYIRLLIDKGQSLFLQLIGGTFALTMVLSIMPENVKGNLNTLLTMLMPAREKELSKTHRDYWLDAIILGLAACLTHLLFERTGELASIFFAHELPRSFAETDTLSGAFNSIGPLYSLIDSVREIVSQPCNYLCVGALIYVLKIRKFYQALILCFLLNVPGVLLQRTVPDMVLFLIPAVLRFSFLYFVTAWSVRHNLLALFMFTLFSQLLLRFNLFFEAGKRVFIWDLLALLILALVPLLYLTFNQRLHKLSKALTSKKFSKV